MEPVKTAEPDARGSGEWAELGGRIRHRAIEALDLITILIQDSVILVAGFLAEVAYEKWLHSSQPLFQFALSLSSGLFLLLYAVTVTFHIMEYVWARFGGGPSPASRLGRYVPWSLAAFGVLASAFATTIPTLRRDATIADTRVYRATIAPPAGVDSTSVTPANRLALSPDGRRLAFVGTGRDGRSLLWVRELEGLAAQPLEGTEGAWSPFWSPDSRALGFVAGGKLKRIDASGGPALTLADSAFVATGAWNRDNVILFTPTDRLPLSRIPAAGGTPSPVTALDVGTGEMSHRFPFFLPDGRHFLYTAFIADQGRTVYLGSLDPTERPRRLADGSNTQYAQGHLLVLRDTTLMAQPFDATRLLLTGDPSLLVERIAINPETRTGAFSVSQTGVLVYQSGAAVSRLVWFDRRGTEMGLLGELAAYSHLRLSPDGRRASVGVSEGEGANYTTWIFDVARGLRTRFTFDPSDRLWSIWSPDGSRVVFQSSRKGHQDLYQKASTGSGTEEVLLASNRDKEPVSWSPDGRFILYQEIGDPTSGWNLWVLPLTGDRKPFPYLQTRFHEQQGQFSPDGRWIAYTSDESGRKEVYVGPFPGTGGKWQVSTAGGNQPRWRQDGKELFYVAADNSLMAATVKSGAAAFEVEAVQTLFQIRPGGFLPLRVYQYDVTADGRRFLVNTRVDQVAVPTPITLVVNWTAGLKK